MMMMVIIMMNTKKINSIRRLFDGFKPIKTDDRFDGKKIDI